MSWCEAWLRRLVCIALPVSGTAKIGMASSNSGFTRIKMLEGKLFEQFGI
jgi:hypothetical protein